MVLLAETPTRFSSAAKVLRGLPQSMRDDRTARGLTVKQQAKAVGVSADTLTRLDEGSNPTQSTILACLDYLSTPN